MMANPEYLLAEAYPHVADRRLRFSRDQFVLLLAAANELFLGIDIFLAHNTNGKIHFNEWIPIVFGPTAAVLLLVAGLLAFRRRATAIVIANATFVASAVVGFLGIWFHLRRAGLPVGELGERFTTRLLVWGPPFLGPAMFVLVALWGISAAWIEEPAGSGRLRLFRNRHIQLPLPKTDVYFLLVGTGAMVATISAVLDHARTGWENPYLWIPTTVGVFSAIVCLAMAAFRRYRPEDVRVFLATMIALVLTGLLGLLLHINDNLTSRGLIVAERFIRGAPVMAPLLFANVGLMGVVTLLDPRGERGAEEPELASVSHVD